MALRWGICGSGRISNSFASALKTLSNDEHKLEAIGARDEQNAKNFADQHGMSKAYASYQELAKDVDVDVVFIGVIDSEHRNACELMLNNNKHVLCQKPLALTHDQAKEILDLAKEKKLFCMEAIAARFSPAYSKIRELISERKIGDVKVVLANYGIPIMHKERVAKNELGGGAILDIGIYPIQFALMAFEGKAPLTITAKGFLSESGVDDTSTVILGFPDNRIASLTCSASTQLSGEAHIFGTKGQIKVPHLMSRPTKLEVTDSDGNIETLDFPIPSEASNVKEASLRYLADAVNVCIRRDKLKSPLMSHEHSLAIASIMDTARHGVGYLLDHERSRINMPCQ